MPSHCLCRESRSSAGLVGQQQSRHGCAVFLNPRIGETERILCKVLKTGFFRNYRKKFGKQQSTSSGSEEIYRGHPPAKSNWNRIRPAPSGRTEEEVLARMQHRFWRYQWNISSLGSLISSRFYPGRNYNNYFLQDD